MRYFKFLSLFLLLNLTFCDFIQGQNRKPKVALVLSGGGAKGLAHIPLIQALDSLNIVPDLIVGTSMGSIVGGLYASGYSGDSLAVIAKNLDWNQLLGGITPYNYITQEEKDEYNNYVISLDISEKKLSTNRYLLNDQNLRDILGILTFPVYNISNFDELSIPFRAIATDIINAESRVIAEGDISVAMRASMSIPGVFEPVAYDSTLLVDGGLFNNFPTDIAKDLGADIIIGSDVSGLGYTLEQIDNLEKVITQSMMLTHNKVCVDNQNLCDLFLNHVPYLSYSTGDFNNSSEIYEEGKIAVALKMEELEKLSKKLNQFEQRNHTLPSSTDKVSFDTIVVRNISEGNLAIINQRLQIQPFEEYSIQTLVSKFNQIMGTMLMKKVEYSRYLENEKDGLLLTGYEKAPIQIRLSPHYDTYRGFGLVLNFTGRNIFGNTSRFLTTLDLADQPKFLIQNQVNIGKKKNWWLRTQAIGKFLDQEIFDNGDDAGRLDERAFLVSNYFNRNINPINSSIGLGVHYGYTLVKPKVKTSILDNVLSLERYKSQSLSLDFVYQYNTLNTNLYPQKGMTLSIGVRRAFLQDTDILFTSSVLESVSGKLNGTSQVYCNLDKRIDVSEKVTGLVVASLGFNFADKLKENELSFFDFGYNELFFLGGSLPHQKSRSTIFFGLHEEEIRASQLAMLGLGVQIAPVNNFYITPSVDFAAVGFDSIHDFINNLSGINSDWTSLNQTSYLLSIGTTFSYNSILGPIDINATWVNGINELRLFLGLGIPFNK